MICYRDMTFCRFYEGCIHTGCPRRLTSEVRKDAAERRLPISQFMERPGCYVTQDESGDIE